MMSITIIALLPSEVPTMSFATGSIATINIMKGMLRKKLTTKPKILLTGLFGQMPLLSVTQRITPSGRPMR